MQEPRTNRSDKQINGRNAIGAPVIKSEFAVFFFGALFPNSARRHTFIFAFDNKPRSLFPVIFVGRFLEEILFAGDKGARVCPGTLAVQIKRHTNIWTYVM